MDSFVRNQTGQNGEEFMEIEKALRTFSNEGLLTKIECRVIASFRELDARKIALYNIITSKYKQDPMSVLEMLKILTLESEEETNANTEFSNFEMNQEEINGDPLNETGKNPLLIDTVIHNVLKFLPLSEIKKYRLVNQQWNTTAEPFLRKRGVIHFHPETLKPSDFLLVQGFSLPDLPFTAFKFSSDSIEWCPSEIQQFFDEWGHNIKSVEFREIILNKEMRNAGYHDVSCWIRKAKNLKKLKIKCLPPLLAGDCLGIALDALETVEFISLANCAIIFPDEGKSHLMAPKEIYFEQGVFVRPVNNICFNDYIDFSHSLKIDIRKNVGKDMEFDMSSVVLNAESVHFDGISVENWGGAKGKVGSIFLYDVSLTERNNLEIKELALKSGTIDMSVIPLTIEKLRFSGITEIICDYSLQLPNLTFLGLCQMSQSNLDVISRFACCANLVEVEIVGSTVGPYLRLNAGDIPKSVKKLKIRDVKIDTSGLHKRQLETLIIEQFNFENFFDDVTEMLSKKILTVDVLVISCVDVADLKTFDIIRFVKSNVEEVKTIEKLVIGVVGDLCLHINLKFKESAFSRYVDKESNYYQFASKVGESITREEFEAFRNIDH